MNIKVIPISKKSFPFLQEGQKRNASQGSTAFVTHLPIDYSVSVKVDESWAQYLLAFPRAYVVGQPQNNVLGTTHKWKLVVVFCTRQQSTPKHEKLQHSFMETFVNTLPPLHQPSNTANTPTI